MDSRPDDEDNKSANRGTSPRVSEVLLRTQLGGMTQAEMARKTGLNRGVLNQLIGNKTSSTPRLIGRICSVLQPEDANELVEAYLMDLAEQVWAEEQARGTRRKTKRNFRISYPPSESPRG